MTYPIIFVRFATVSDLKSHPATLCPWFVFRNLFLYADAGIIDLQGFYNLAYQLLVRRQILYGTDAPRMPHSGFG